MFFTKNEAILEKILKQKKCPMQNKYTFQTNQAILQRICKAKPNALCKINIHLFQSRLLRHHAVT